MIRSSYNHVARFVCGTGLLPVLLLSVILSSCIGTSSDTTTYSDTALTGFTLGSLKTQRTYHVTSSSGEDSTYTITTTYSGSSTPVHINQNTNEVYNSDSLKFGTNLSKVVCTISTLNNGQVYFRSLTDPTTYQYYSSTDSIDLTEERILRVRSSDGTQTRDYTVNISACQVNHDSVTWDNTPVNDASSRVLLSSFSSMTGKTTKDAMYILGRTDDGIASLLKSGDDGVTWTKVDVSLPKETSCLFCSDDTLMVLLEDTKQIMKLLPDGDIRYTKIESVADYSPKSETYITPIGGDGGYLYAVHGEGRRVYVSCDGGVTWQTEETDATDFINNDYRLPVTEVNGIFADTKENDLTRIIIVGNCVDEDLIDDTYFKYASVWSKVVDREVGAPEHHDRWTYCQQTGLNVPVRLPNRENLTVTLWDDVIVAFGGEARYDEKAYEYDRLYVSYDSGTTWASSDLALPKGYECGTAGMVMTDTFGRLVIIGNGRVWRCLK